MKKLKITKRYSRKKNNKSKKKLDGTIGNKFYFEDLLKISNHNTYYIVDANMILAYINNTIPFWVEYVNFLSSKGKRFFVSPRILLELLSHPLPTQFHLLNGSEFDYVNIDFKVDNAYNDILSEFKMSNTKKFETDAKWILEAGHVMYTCETIPIEELGNDNFYAITFNATMIKRFIKLKDKRDKINKIINLNGLDYLVNFCEVNKDGSYNIYKTFPD